MVFPSLLLASRLRTAKALGLRRKVAMEIVNFNLSTAAGPDRVNRTRRGLSFLPFPAVFRPRLTISQVYPEMLLKTKEGEKR
jgi:hypothetical protein